MTVKARDFHTLLEELQQQVEAIGKEYVPEQIGKAITTTFAELQETFTKLPAAKHKGIAGYFTALQDTVAKVTMVTKTELQIKIKALAQIANVEIILPPESEQSSAKATDPQATLDKLVLIPGGPYREASLNEFALHMIQAGHYHFAANAIILIQTPEIRIALQEMIPDETIVKYLESFEEMETIHLFYLIEIMRDQQLREEWYSFYADAFFNIVVSGDMTDKLKKQIMQKINSRALSAKITQLLAEKKGELAFTVINQYGSHSQQRVGLYQIFPALIKSDIKLAKKLIEDVKENSLRTSLKRLFPKGETLSEFQKTSASILSRMDALGKAMVTMPSEEVEGAIELVKRVEKALASLRDRVEKKA